jgi:RNA polymerase sigma-70 factor (ECF subfamily)
MDANTFKGVFIPLHKKLYRMAYRLLEDASEAEDVVQETYIKLWEKREELELLRNPESFCIVMVRNLCMDILRSARNKIDSLDLQNIEKSDFTTIISDYETNESLGIINKIVEKLPEQSKLVFKLRHYDDYSFEEIEKITGLSSVNIRVILSRSRKFIKDNYNSFYNKELNYNTEIEKEYCLNITQ